MGMILGQTLTRETEDSDLKFNVFYSGCIIIANPNYYHRTTCSGIHKIIRDLSLFFTFRVNFTDLP